MFMVKKAKDILAVLGFVIAFAGLILCSQTVKDGAFKGITLCLQVVIPSLFVFMCVSQWFTLSGGAVLLSRMLSPLFRLFLGSAYQGGSGLLLCLLGGYPMGAATLVGLKDQKVLTAVQIKGLALLFFAPSPAFVITAVGQGMLHSVEAGLLLYAGCTLSVLLMSMVGSRWIKSEKMVEKSKPNASIHVADTFVISVSFATEKMITLCAMVVVFSTLSALVNRISLPTPFSLAFSGIGEVTLGCQELCGRVPLWVLSMVLSFGGVCTHMQVKGILGEDMPPYGQYLAVRVLGAVLSGGITKGLLWLFPQAIPTLSTGRVTMNDHFSPLASVALLITCVVFLNSFQIFMEKRKDCYEKSGICA
jgi:hypothetical protein